MMSGKKDKIVAKNPLIAGGFVCFFNLKTKKAEIQNSSGNVILTNFSLPFINNENDFIENFIAISALCGIIGHGQRSKRENEKFEWYFEKVISESVVQIKTGDKLVYCPHYFDNGNPALYLRRGKFKIHWGNPSRNKLNFLRSDKTIGQFAKFIGLVYNLKVGYAIVEKENICWPFLRKKIY